MKYVTALVLTLPLLTLTACGGGGGDEAAPVTTAPVVQDPVSFNVSVTDVDIRDSNGNPVTVDVSGLSNTLTLE